MSFSGESPPVLITGADGQLGAAFRRLLPTAVATGRNDLDLTAVDRMRDTVGSMQPAAIINCAAFTDVDRAETDEDLATIVNGHAVGGLAAVAADLAIPFVTFSTDYVFAGDIERPYVESDPTEPINAYGRSKVVGERLALENHPSTLVVRTSWVVSGTHDNFVSTMLRLASSDRSEIRVVDDQHGCPTIADDLAAQTLSALDLGATGMLHVANGPPATWYDLAVSAIGRSGLDATISRCTTAEFPRTAARPAYSVLGSERTHELGLKPMNPWQESLVDVVDRQMRRLDLAP